jgi:hypothetical protein
MVDSRKEFPARRAMTFALDDLLRANALIGAACAFQPFDMHENIRDARIVSLIAA